MVLGVLSKLALSNHLSLLPRDAGFACRFVSARMLHTRVDPAKLLLNEKTYITVISFEALRLFLVMGTDGCAPCIPKLGSHGRLRACEIRSSCLWTWGWGYGSALFWKARIDVVLLLLEFYWTVLTYIEVCGDFERCISRSARTLILYVVGSLSPLIGAL